MKLWLATRLRYLADRIHPDTAFRHPGLHFTMESGRTAVINDQGRGCPIWYYGHADYECAHTEAVSPMRRIDWGGRR